MAKAKTKKTVAKKPAQAKSAAAVNDAPDAGDWDLPATADEFIQASLSWEDRQLLATVIRFLYTVVDRRFLRRARQAHYTKKEHDHLWSLFDVAAGRQHELDDGLEDFNDDPDRKSLVIEIDQFENFWFPQAEKIIRRFAPEGTADKFVATFFKDLSQQPLGPGVLDSVSTFLNRVDELGKSKLDGAADVLSAIRERGVTEAKATELRAKIKSLRGASKSAGDIAAAAVAAKKQLDALRQLRLAWNDWSAMLRPRFDIREQIQLGLTEPRRASADTTAPTPAPATAPAATTNGASDGAAATAAASPK